MYVRQHMPLFQDFTSLLRNRDASFSTRELAQPAAAKSLRYLSQCHYAASILIASAPEIVITWNIGRHYCFKGWRKQNWGSIIVSYKPAVTATFWREQRDMNILFLAWKRILIKKALIWDWLLTCTLPKDEVSKKWPVPLTAFLLRVSGCKKNAA